jgi:outer membrane protein insertion porin family
MIFVVLVAALAAALLPPARAQQAAAEQTSKLLSITVSGTKRYPTDQIAAASGLTVGQQIGRNELQAAADQLSELGTFSQVNYRFKTSPGGVALEFVVQDAPSDAVEYDNIPWFTDDEITAALEKSVPLFDGTAPEGGTILDQLNAALQALLPTRGVQAAVEHDLASDPLTDTKIVEFHIDGADLKVASLLFGDPAASADAHVHQSMSDIVGKPYSRMTAELFELEQVRPVYLATGHLRVKFAAPVVKFQGDPNGPAPTSLIVTLPIDPGAVYHFSGVQWNGNTMMDAIALNALIGIKSGDVADGMQIANAWNKIERAYGQKGHLDAKLTPQQTIDDASGGVSYDVSIDEGPLYRMGDLVITGLSLDGETRVRSAFHLSPAQIFDQAYVDQFIEKLQKPTADIFGNLPIHYTAVGSWVRPNSDTHLADVLLDFK